MQIGRAVLRAAPVIALVCATAGLAGAVRVTATRAEAAPTPAQTAGSYVGQETCLTCHDGQDQTYAKTPHGRAADARTPAAT
jgi:cytochrome c5